MGRPLKLLAIAVLHLALLWGWIALLDAKRGPMPSLGRFLSPFEGFWRNAEAFSLGARPTLGGSRSRNEEVTLPGLPGTVVAEFDKRGVPHLFAPDLYSLFYAQGYVTARDRLWQMDIQSRAGLGRLSEIMGPGLLRFDLERRRMGMPASAVASLKMMQADGLTHVALGGYTDGVNAWISSLKKATYPLEFKLLGYAPEPWTPLKSVVLIKNMQWTLSRSHDDVRLTRVLDSLGAGFFSRYYPSRHPGAEPILPGDVFPVGDSGLPSAGSGGSTASASASYGKRLAGTSASGVGAGPAPVVPTSPFPRPNPASGSNNFVLAGTRTRTGYPILANDPHLDLTLPALWYEIQIKSGRLNAYGASLPGLPGVVIGFTQGTAWGLTNGMDDVFDWVETRFRGDSLKEYLWRGRWRKARLVLDTIPVRGRAPVVDTQVWTHVGPVPVKPGEAPFSDDTPPAHALQWTALQASNELGAFLRLLTAEDVGGFRRAIRGLHTPSQNIAFATRRDIALAHHGRIPAKREGQGRLLGRSTYSGEWRGYVPLAKLPAAVNPARGWLASANQEVTDPGYPHYLGSGFYPPERSQRLNRLMFNAHGVTLASAWDILLDDYSRLAAQALPPLLRLLPPESDPSDTAAPPATRADSVREGAAELLRAWDFRYAAPAAAPGLFDLWWKGFYRRTWEDDLRGDTVSYPRPSRAVTLGLLLADTLAEAFDDVRTQRVESAGDLARAAFDEALQSLGLEPGAAPPAWGSFRPVAIPHLLRLPALGVSGLRTSGCGECVNAQRGTHGPSWRMVVQTGRRPEAWGIYPGGQSGNPGSPAYDAFVKDWAGGRAYRLLFLQWPLEVPDSTQYILALKGKR